MGMEWIYINTKQDIFNIQNVEVYNIGNKNMNKINENYDFAGYIIYGDTFK